MTFTDEQIQDIYDARDYETCLSMVTESLKFKPGHVHNTILQASCWTRLDTNLDEAVEALKEIVERFPSNVFANYQLGYTLYCASRISESLGQLYKVVELDPPRDRIFQKTLEFIRKCESISAAVTNGKNFVADTKEFSQKLCTHHCSVEKLRQK